MDAAPRVIEPHTPRLPAELEREIFELAGWNDYATAYSLIHVAKRVHEWIEPLLYRVIRLELEAQHTSSLIERFEAIEDGDSLDFKNLRRQARHVRHYIHSASRYNLNSLSLCTSIVDLALWCSLICFDNPAIIKVISDLHLRRLSVCADFLDIHPQMPTIFHNTALAESLTHLDVFEGAQFWKEGWKLVKNFPRLTHIALDGGPDYAGETIELLLDAMPKLLLVVDLDNSKQHSPELVEDPRFIAYKYPGNDILFPKFWIEGTCQGTGMDFWALAEELQRKKRDRLSQAY